MAMGGGPASLIELGVVGAPFGVRGWVKLRSFTEPPERLLQHRNFLLGIGGSWVAYSIEASGRSAGQLTAKLKGVNDRDQAQGLRGAAVGVPRSELPPRDEKDFLRADLIGCEVVNLAGRCLGTVRHFVETPAQVLMVVRGAAAPGLVASGSKEFGATRAPGATTPGGVAPGATTQGTVADGAQQSGPQEEPGLQEELDPQEEPGLHQRGPREQRAREYWVPAVPRHLRRVDLEARRVVVDWDDAAG